MGKQNLAVNQLLERKDIFADFMNGTLFHGDAFLSGILPEDHLCPVITTIFYLGESWDGSRSLYDMFGLNEEGESNRMLWEYLPNYQINLISAYDIPHTENFRTCLQSIFDMLKYNKDKKRLYEYITSHRDKLRKMDRVEMMAAFVLLGEQKRVEKLLQEHSGEEGMDMCKAIDDLIKDGEEKGKIEGENRVLALIHALIADGRQNLIGCVTEDRVLREQLYQQYRV